MSHAGRYLDAVGGTALAIDAQAIDEMAAALLMVRGRNGRLFILGVGGSAANASHAVNDFRKLCSIQAYAPTDNVSELTARTNDDGWETVFAEYLKGCRLGHDDAIFVLSVGGGNAEKNVSANLVRAIDYAKSVDALVFGIVGRDGGHTKRRGDHVIVVPTIHDDLITPLAEAFQGVLWHALVSHPLLAVQKAKWESVAA